jgi:superfamily I DNA and/or RNA helicase
VICRSGSEQVGRAVKQPMARYPRVGTVGLFQGQDAEAVLISMVTSSGDDFPRNIEFLYSKHRLNVAISRARTLTVIVASPRLLDIACHTVEQMRLVNTLCWVKAYAESDACSP